MKDFFSLVMSMALKKNLESLWGIESQTFRFTTLMIYYWVTETLLWAQLLQGPHVTDASCKVGLLELKAFLKANQSPLFSPHTFDWSFWYKTSLSMSVVFPESIWAEIPIFLILTHPSVKKRRHCYKCIQPFLVNKLTVV